MCTVSAGGYLLEMTTLLILINSYTSSSRLVKSVQFNLQMFHELHIIMWAQFDAWPWTRRGVCGDSAMSEVCFLYPLFMLAGDNTTVHLQETQPRWSTFGGRNWDFLTSRFKCGRSFRRVPRQAFPIVTRQTARHDANKIESDHRVKVP